MPRLSADGHLIGSEIEAFIEGGYPQSAKTGLHKGPYEARHREANTDRTRTASDCGCTEDCASLKPQGAQTAFSTMSSASWILRFVSSSSANDATSSPSRSTLSVARSNGLRM